MTNLKTRWTRNAKQRLQKVFGAAEFDFLQSEFESFDSRLTIVQPPATQEEFENLANTRAGSLRLTPPRYLKVFDPQVLTITRKRSFLDIRPEWSVIIRAAGANHRHDY